MAVAVSQALLNKIRDSISDYRVHLSEYDNHQDGTYNPIKAFLTITVDTGAFFGDVRINNISVKQADAKEPNDIEILFPSKWNKKNDRAYENVQFRDPRVMDGLREVCREFYLDALDASEK
jgi:hypothetical protein